MASPKVIVADTRDVSCAKATDATSNVIPAHCPEMGSAEAADVASIEATHVATAEATTPVASAAATTTASLRISGNKAACKQCSCQDHHHSSFHDILLLGWRFVRRRHRPWHRQ
jgi:hypothetical protein